MSVKYKEINENFLNIFPIIIGVYRLETIKDINQNDFINEKIEKIILTESETRTELKYLCDFLALAKKVEIKKPKNDLIL